MNARIAASVVLIVFVLALATGMTLATPAPAGCFQPTAAAQPCR